MLDHGVLHADPHPGNLMVTDDGRLALLDLGMVSSVAPRLQDKVVKLLLAIGDGDGEEVAAILAGMGHPLEEYDAGAFRSEVAHLVSRPPPRTRAPGRHGPRRASAGCPARTGCARRPRCR